jgi:RimJ/RimL family protein N-acetyltransferase
MQVIPQIGIQYLEAVTSLLQRIGQFDHTAGLLEAADLHWWWRSPRSTDSFPQLFWFDDLGRPEAAIIATDWGDGVALDPIIMPNADPDWVAHVLESGLNHAQESGLQNVDVVVDRADRVVQEVLRRHGFTTKEDEKHDVVLACLTITDRPPVSSLRDDYRLCNRLSTSQRPHHMITRNGPELEVRLRQSWLYRPELDLLVLDTSENVAAYGLLWFDPTTATGLVEPMRTEDDHQQRGLARHVLTVGIDLLAATGAQRVKLCFKPANTAARDLYLGVGFKPYKQTSIFSRG